jgi:NAD(P)-dependent dehydrogenase (short-subunit alcohol dehydrogenase family)
MNDSPGPAAKVVAVTGADRGIGRAIALYTASPGASVVVNDLGESADGFGSGGGPASEGAAEITAELEALLLPDPSQVMEKPPSTTIVWPVT